MAKCIRACIHPLVVLSLLFFRCCPLALVILAGRWWFDIQATRRPDALPLTHHTPHTLWSVLPSCVLPACLSRARRRKRGSCLVLVGGVGLTVRPLLLTRFIVPCRIVPLDHACSESVYVEVKVMFFLVRAVCFCSFAVVCCCLFSVLYLEWLRGREMIEWTGGGEYLLILFCHVILSLHVGGFR